jgi:hypothetical protein
MSYKLFYGGKGFIISFSGIVSIDELNEGNGDIQGHEKFDNHRYQIVDLREADLSGVSLEETEEPAGTDLFASMINTSVRIALIVSDVIAHTVCQEFVNKSLAIGSPWKYGIFYDYDKALTWAKT